MSGIKPKTKPKTRVQESSVKEPKQTRSQQTYERILEVVTTLVQKDAYEDATVNEIVRLAKCSVGAFYGRFRDKDAAMFALYDARCSALEKKVSVIFKKGEAANKSLAEIMADFVDCTINHTFSNAAFIRAERYLSSAKTATPFWARSKTMNAEFLQLLTNLLKERRHEITHKDPKAAALITLSIIGGLPRDAVKTAPKLFDRPSNMIKNYKAEIRRVVLGYLGCK